jgi:N-acetylmuramoyl-L-alanine amidase
MMTITLEWVITVPKSIASNVGEWIVSLRTCRPARRTTLSAVTGRRRGWLPRAGFFLGAVVATAALVVAGDGGPAGARALAPGAVDRTATPAIGGLRPPLAGMTVGIDPGHNGRNYADPDYIDRQVWNGREWENCDTTGTETDGGYTEALFNFRVAEYLRADLIRAGARVIMTRDSNHGVGPCVTTRSYIINKSHANVAVDIHADGGPASGRGFAVLEPVADGPNDKVIGASARLGADIRAAMLAYTAMPVSDYDGKNGINHRDDLAGLNLTKVPKILIEVGNMRNATDAKMLTSAKFQQEVAKALLQAIIRFLR